MKTAKILVKITEANEMANEHRRMFEQTNDPKEMFLALGYRMEVERLMKEVA